MKEGRKKIIGMHFMKPGFIKAVLYKSACFIAVFFLALLFGCQEAVDWDLKTGNDFRLVVLGNISNERKAHEVSLSLPVLEMNGEQEAVSGASVTISDGDQVFLLEEDIQRPGIYVTEPTVQGVVNKVYTLTIEYDGYVYTADASMIPVSAINELGTHQVSQDPELYIVYFIKGFESYRIRLDLDWSEVERYSGLPEEKNHAVLYGYNFGRMNVDVNEIFSPAEERVPFPPGTRAIIAKESLSDEYAEYLRGMMSETSWNGGLFDVNPGNPYTNLSEGAIGFFSATTVTRDTLVFWP